jgi:hypothetical protein
VVTPPAAVVEVDEAGKVRVMIFSSASESCGVPGALMGEAGSDRASERRWVVRDIPGGWGVAVERMGWKGCNLVTIVGGPVGEMNFG